MCKFVNENNQIATVEKVNTNCGEVIFTLNGTRRVQELKSFFNEFFPA